LIETISSMLNAIAMAKELYFNHNGSALEKLLACVDFVAKVVGVTSGPKGRILVLHIKLHPKIVKDTESVLNRLIGGCFGVCGS
ncbi:unnamed protein product, partial [Coffea canephora]